MHDGVHDMKLIHSISFSFVSRWLKALAISLACAAAGNAAAETRIMRDVGYGAMPQQRCDIYAPPQANKAPVIMMFHGGGWAYGDKTHANSIDNKVARWVPKGFVVISCNYRMLPDAKPLTQVEDIARALGEMQAQASGWGGDKERFILMGHSAGAHLVALLAATPSLRGDYGARPPLGTVALDSAAYDVVAIMSQPHLKLYDHAFGSDDSYWRMASPYYALSTAPAPMLSVCSTRRADSCAQAKRFAAKAHSLGGEVEVLPQNLSHMEINQQLGLANAYTQAVERFMSALDPTVARLLDQR